MSTMWLLVRAPGGTFDVRVDDTDKTNLMELIEYMFEDSVKQNVYLPKYFTLFVTKPRTNRKLELVDDGAMLKMWEWNEGNSEIEVFIEETETPSLVFQSAEASWAKTLKNRAENIRLMEEENRRMAEEAEAEEQLLVQQAYTVAVEVPVLNVDDGEIEYVTVFATPVADEVLPGDSQLQPSQSQPSQPQSSQPQPSQPPCSQTSQPNNPPRRKKLTPKKKKIPPA